MGRLSQKAAIFVAGYERHYQAHKEIARRIEDLVRQVVRDLSVDIHLVTARAKAPDSLRGKLRRKNYSDPAAEVTDTVGVRIITYYRSGVDPVAEALKREFHIDRARSEDKRRLLDLREFGYGIRLVRLQSFAEC